MALGMPGEKSKVRFPLELRKLAAVGNNQGEDTIQTRVILPCRARLLAVVGVVGTLTNTGAQIQICKGEAAAAAGNRLLSAAIVDPASATPFAGVVALANRDLPANTAITLRTITDADANLTDTVITLWLQPLDVT